MALRDFTEAWQQMNTDHYSPGVHKHKSTVPLYVFDVPLAIHG